MDNLEEDLTCSVCYSLFADPRVLSCSHSFCKACLDNLLTASDSYSIWRPLRLLLKCPNCRSVVELPPTGVDALPTNLSLRAIVEKYQSDGEPRPPSCEEHHCQPLNMYCIQDRKLICGLCLTVGQHRGHPIDDPHAAFIREKQTPSQLLTTLSERWTQVCELGEQLEQEKARCEGLLRQDKQDVLHFFQTMEALLARKRQAYLGALDKAGEEVVQAYDPVIHQVKELQEEQLDLVSLGSSVEEEFSPLVFLERVHAFRERVEEFIERPLPPAVSVSVTPRAAEHLQRHWPAVTIGALEDAPIPKVCCCARCGGVELDAEAAGQRQHPDVQNPQSERRRAASAPPLMLLTLPTLLVLLAAALWVCPGGGASLGLSLVSEFSQVVQSVCGDLLTSVWDTAGRAYRAAGTAAEGWSSQLWSVSRPLH